MSFTWPLGLVVLLAAPLLLANLWWTRRKRRKLTVRVSSVALIRNAIPKRAHWKRRVPLVLLVVSMLTLGVAAARPTATVAVSRSSTSILLAMDVSRSMCSTDVSPNRLVVAQQAARTFIASQGDGTRIGIVAFAGIAGLVVPPTTDTKVLLEAIDRLTTSRGTAIGMAILASIDAIAEHNPQVQPTGVELGDGTVDTPTTGQPPTGAFQPDTIVVLTDGANTQGVDPLIAAQQAAARRIRVYTIGFGTTTPSPPVCNIDQIGDGFPTPGPPIDIGGTGGGGRPGRFLEIDEPTLKGIARMTGGQYFRAQDAAQLDTVFQDLPNEVVTQHEKQELTVWFVLVAAILAAGAIGLSLAWNRYP